MDGLSAGQLSFLLSAGLDTTNSSQPQEMNDTCRCLCWDLSPIVLHILNGCPMALDQSRYTWRHDGVLTLWDLNYQAMNVYYQPTRVEIQENPRSTIPHDLAVTTARPDMIYKCNNTVVLIELMILISIHQRVYKMLNQKNKANNFISKSWVTWTQHGNRPCMDLGHHWNWVTWPLSPVTL